MPQPALNIITRAMQRAKVGNINFVTGQVQGYLTQAIQELNSLLDFIAETIDFSAAMGTFNFTFNTNLVTIGHGNITAAGPNPLPLDYLRVETSGGASGAQRSSTWYLQGVPYPMVEIDLSEWDMQVQQAGMQSYPYFWAKDMSQRQIVLNTTGDITTGSTTVYNVPSITGIVPGMSIAGGIGPQSLITPGTYITAVTIFNDASVTGNVVNGSTAVSALSANAITQGWVVGMAISGTGIPAGATIASIDITGTSLTLSIAATATNLIGLTVSSNELTLSQPPIASGAQAIQSLIWGQTAWGEGVWGGVTTTQLQASLMIGYPPVGLPYPPPSGAYDAQIRYQRLMPPLTLAQVNAGAFCWFPDDMVLIAGLAGLLMQYSDDGRSNEFIGTGMGSGTGQFGGRIASYIKTADDKSNRSQQVLLDRRNFGKSFSLLKNTKLVGW